jgi:hypothetical protein
LLVLGGLGFGVLDVDGRVGLEICSRVFGAACSPTVHVDRNLVSLDGSLRDHSD